MTDVQTSSATVHWTASIRTRSERLRYATLLAPSLSGAAIKVLELIDDEEQLVGIERGDH